MISQKRRSALAVELHNVKFTLHDMSHHIYITVSQHMAYISHQQWRTLEGDFSLTGGLVRPVGPVIPASQLTKMLQLEMKRHTFSFLLFASVARTKKQLIDVRLVLSVFFVPCNPTIRSCVHNWTFRKKDPWVISSTECDQTTCVHSHNSHLCMPNYVWQLSASTSEKDQIRWYLTPSGTIKIKSLWKQY